MTYVISYILSMNRETLILGVVLIVYCIALVVTHSLFFKNKNDDKSGKSKKLIIVWDILCFVPLVLCFVHFTGHYLKGMLLYTLKLYLPMYSGAVLMALFPLFEHRKRFIITKVAASVLTALGMCVSLVFLLVTDWAIVIGNGTQMGYVKSFELLTEEMEKHYVLNEWKDIDYDKIKAELLPEISEAEKNNDAEAFYFALCKYINYFHDGHIWIEASTEKGVKACLEIDSQLMGNDYGFSLFTVSSGETIAVLVEKGCEAAEYGITDGTVITKWNGVPIEKAISDAEIIPIEREPVLSNTELVKPLWFAGTGGDIVEVAFIDQDGKEKTVSIKSMGSYEQRLNYAECCLYNEPQLPTQSEIAEMSAEEIQALVAKLQKERENFKSELITEDCGYLAINSEELDVFKDTLAEIRGSYPEVTELVDNKLQAMKEQGMKKLVIDARNNSGGYSIIINAVVTLFTNREIFMGTNMYVPYTGGEMKEMSEYVVPANGKWADLPVIVLTNSKCASSGDGLVYALSHCPNVKTMGISDTEGIYQSVGAICFLTDSDFSVRYPMFPTVDKNGDPFIDPSADRISRFSVDERIPITREAALEIFSFDEREGLDYQLRYAIGSFN